MKKYIISLIVVISTLNISSAQNYVDNALLFSTNNYSGTARFVGMSGAFGALGGDFSSLSINPAGIGIYRSSEFVFTPGMSNHTNLSTYIGNSIEETGYNMNLNNLGFVASYDLENNDSRWVNFNIGIGFNRINDLNDDVIFNGVNNSSLMEVFVAYANADATPENPEYLDGMYENLLWEIYVLDSAGGVFYNEIDDAAYVYDPVADEWVHNPDFEIRQQKVIRNEGSISEFNITFGGNYAHKLYVGGSIGINRLRYTQYTSHYELETDDLPISYMRGFDFREHSTTKGTGFTLKLGAIYKPIEFIRLGAAIHLPTFYSLDQEFHNEAIGYFDTEPTGSITSPTIEYNYNLTTTFRAIGSMGVQIGKVGLLDIDYEYADYSKIRLDDDINSDGVIQDNNTIKEQFISTHNIRAGAEARFGKIYLRAGGAYSTTPYKDINDYNVLSYSGGLGYREDKFFVDFAFAQRKSDYYLSAYNWDYNDATAHIENTLNSYVLTVGFRF